MIYSLHIMGCIWPTLTWQVIAPIPRFGFHHSTWENEMNIEYTQFPWPYNTHEQLKYKLQNSLYYYYYIYIFFFCLSKILKVGLYQYQRLGHTTYFRHRCILILQESSCMGWIMNVMSCRNQIHVFSYFGSTRKGRLLLPNVMAFPIFTAGWHSCNLLYRDMKWTETKNTNDSRFQNKNY